MALVIERKAQAMNMLQKSTASLGKSVASTLTLVLLVSISSCARQDPEIERVRGVVSAFLDAMAKRDGSTALLWVDQATSAWLKAVVEEVQQGDDLELQSPVVRVALARLQDQGLNPQDVTASEILVLIGRDGFRSTAIAVVEPRVEGNRATVGLGGSAKEGFPLLDLTKEAGGWRINFLDFVREADVRLQTHSKEQGISIEELVERLK